MTLLGPEDVSIIYSEKTFDIAGTDRRHRKIVCPLPEHQHHNYTPSFSIYWAGDRWRWRCFGSCNKQGDVIDLIGFMRVPAYDPHDSKKLSEAISMLTEQDYEPAAPKPPVIKHNRLNSTQWQKYYPAGPQVKAYAEGRGIDPLTLREFKIGQTSAPSSRNVRLTGQTWMTIPTFQDGELMGIKLRNIGAGMRYRSLKGSRTAVFNYDMVKYSTDRVYVVKGEIAAMVLMQRGLLACAPTGGESMKLNKHYRNILALADKVVIGDNDANPSVREETSRLAEERAESLDAQLFFPPKEYKDVDEWILNDDNAIKVLKGL